MDKLAQKCEASASILEISNCTAKKQISALREGNTDRIQPLHTFWQLYVNSRKCYFLPVGPSQETWEGTGNNAAGREDFGDKEHKSIELILINSAVHN